MTLRRRWCFKIRFICVLLTFSNFLSGKIKPHIVWTETLSRTFSTIFIHPYLFSYGRIHQDLCDILFRDPFSGSFCPCIHLFKIRFFRLYVSAYLRRQEHRSHGQIQSQKAGNFLFLPPYWSAVLLPPVSYLPWILQEILLSRSRRQEHGLLC